MEPHPYQHEPPHRPVHLPRRIKPPPKRQAPPNLTPFLIAGAALAAVMALLALPYLVGYLIQTIGG